MWQFNINLPKPNSDVVKRKLKVKIGSTAIESFINLDSISIENDKFVGKLNQSIFLTLIDIYDNNSESVFSIERKLSFDNQNSSNFNREVLDIFIVPESGFPDKE